LDPGALLQLRETGSCDIELPEALFDLDYPGHYMRRVRSMSVSIPCVVGPYTSINCTLTLLSNKIRRDGNSQADYEEQEDDSRFVYNFGALQSIATSHAQNDSGMFELNFRDERYLPFEGAGGISRWRIDLPKDNNAFDFNTLADVILHLKYSAREGGKALKEKARAFIKDNIPASGVRFFSAKHDFPNEWYRYFHAPAGPGSEDLKLPLKSHHFPYAFQGTPLTFGNVQIVLIPAAGVDIMPKHPKLGNVQVISSAVQLEGPIGNLVMDQTIVASINNGFKDSGILVEERISDIVLLLPYEK
jgi:hypothetical protein